MSGIVKAASIMNPARAFAVVFLSLVSCSVEIKPRFAGPGVSTYEGLIPPDNFVSGWKRTDRVLRFEKNGLYGYIDGGAELYLEFGFDDLLVQKYTHDSAELALEIYRMECPACALGIYLMRRGEETPIAGISARNTGSRYQLLAVKGNALVQVNNFGGDSALVPAMVALTNQMVAHIPAGDSVMLPSLLPKERLIAGSERLLRGQYGLQPIYTFGEGDVFQLGGKIFAVVGDYRDTTGSTFTRIVIPYPDSVTAQSAYRQVIAGLDSTLTPLAKTRRALIFEDYQHKFGAISVNGRVLEAVVNLLRRPE